MRAVTLVLPYYQNAGMLREQVRRLTALPEDIAPQVHLVVVDDGSPDPAELRRLPNLGSTRLYRILIDVRWNWLACRNLGVAEAKTPWVLLTDMDHVVPERTWRFIMDADLDARSVYRFTRVDAPNDTPYKPHPNSWLMTRERFDAIGGYDERFSGYYGTDGEFHDRIRKTIGHEPVMLDTPLVRYPREVIHDSSTRNYGRKEPQDKDNVKRIRDERDLIPGWRPLRGTFPWERAM